MLFDTSAYSQMVRGQKEVVKVMGELKEIFIPVIVLGELVFGFFGGKNSEENMISLDNFMSRSYVHALSVDALTSGIYAQLAHEAKQAGVSLSNNDIWIASLAIQHDVKVLTTDKDFSRIKMLTDKKLLRLVKI
jgi:tRNA(fMet)-specific endonuclease VapC